MGADKLSAVVARCTKGPVTREWLASDLRALGVVPGMVLMVHTSLSALGYVIGGEVTVCASLRDAVGPSGTLVMPAFLSDNSDPSLWSSPAVPEEWWDMIRAERPAYDQATSLIESPLGVLPAYFWHLPEVLRSNHPSAPWCAQGPQAEFVTANHGLAFGLGEDSPLGRCYDLDGHVLSLGCLRTTVLHLAENRSQWALGRRKATGAAVTIDGERCWVSYESIHDEDADFEQLRLDYMALHSGWSSGPTGYGASRLFRIRPLVDFAVQWIDLHRKLPEPGPAAIVIQ